jgi:uncharacterized SAM-binding protein YcdF (DUF218 family)
MRRLIAELVLPPAGPLILAIVGLVIARWRPRLGRAIAALGVGALFVLTLPIVAHGLAIAAGEAPALDPAAAKAAQAIVIQGGGLRRLAPEYGGDTLGRLTIERVRYGAKLARETGLPILVTGGRATPEMRTEAEVMAEALATEYGLATRWREAESRNTRENARASAPLLRADGVERVLLVAHGFDMRRSRAEFEAAGLVVIPAPTHAAHADDEPFTFHDFLPSLWALQASYYALYEALARVANGPPPSASR